GRPVLDALRHGVGLVPDDLLAEIPTVGSKGKRQHPGQAHQVFLLQAGWRLSVWLFHAGQLLTTAAVLLPKSGHALVAVGFSTGKAVADVHPDRAVVPEYAPNLPENLDKFGHILICSRFKPDLVRMPIIPKLVVWGARYTARYRLRGQRGKY